ncbi:MAG: hypothetical protein RBU25_14180 [Lentisphaeria bacterium]|jgi:hypothetical protein|nr:hypothetical protein [Lentisphaeria bacterium]
MSVKMSVEMSPWASKRAGVIEFVGARKNGYYRVKAAAVISSSTGKQGDHEP